MKSQWRFDDVIAFVQVVQAGSITAAANRMNLAKSVVSKRIHDLEHALDAELFQRSIRQLRPTDTGLAFYERIVPLLQELDEAADTLSAHGAASLRGHLRIAAPMSFGTMYLGPVIAEFARHHPELQLTIDYDDRQVDLTLGGYDLGIRIANLQDSSLRSRELAECPRMIVCSPGYAREHGLPKNISELAQHACIDYAHARSSLFWRFNGQNQGGEPVSVPIRSRIVANNGETIRDMAVAGVGLASLPLFLAAQSLRQGSLIPALPTAVQEPYTISAVYPTTRHVPDKVRAFIDHLLAFFAAPLPWDRTG